MTITVSLFGHEIGRIMIDAAPPAPAPPVNGHRVTDQLVGRTMQMVGRHITHT